MIRSTRQKILASCALIAALAVGVSAQSSNNSDLEGTFVHTPDPGQDAERGAAIESLVASMPPEQRRRWRSQLQHMTLPAPRIQVQDRGGEIALLVGSVDAVRSPSDNQQVQRSDGWRIRQMISDGQLVQRIENGEMKQRYVYELVDRGEGLRIGVRITLRDAAGELQYALRYRRQ